MLTTCSISHLHSKDETQRSLTPSAYCQASVAVSYLETHCLKKGPSSQMNFTRERLHYRVSGYTRACLKMSAPQCTSRTQRRPWRARVQRFILFVRRRAFPEKWGLHAASLSCACAPRLRESFSGLALVPTAGPAPSVTFVARFPRLQIASLSIVYSEEGET